MVKMLLYTQVKSALMEIFRSCNPLKDYNVKIYEIDADFRERYKQKTKCDKNGNEYMLLETDIYFNKYSLVVDIKDQDEDKYLIFEIKRQKAIEEELNCKFIRINRFNSFNSEIAYIQKFIVDFKDNEIKELNHTIVNKLKLFQTLIQLLIKKYIYSI